MPSARPARMFAIRNRHGANVCVMRTKRLAISAAEILTGQTWDHLSGVDGCQVVRVTVDPADRSTSGASDLWEEFARGQTWVTLPRSLLHEMPDDWQSRFAELLDEWDAEWNWPDDFPVSRVQAVGAKNRFTRFPPWLLEYKYREKNRAEIEALRSKAD